jgi:hypothetical protein
VYCPANQPLAGSQTPAEWENRIAEDKKTARLLTGQLFPYSLSKINSCQSRKR